MGVALQHVTIDECKKLHEMQLLGFQALLEKYQDYDTSPGAETLEKVRWRFENPAVGQYWIQLDTERIGYIRVYENIGFVRKYETEENVCRLSMLFILPAFQGLGYAQEAIRLAEAKYPQAQAWELDTIKQEAKLRHLYEKMGYRPAGTEHNIKPGMDLVDYIKP